jgi:hypothetical protein
MIRDLPRIDNASIALRFQRGKDFRDRTTRILIMTE